MKRRLEIAYSTQILLAYEILNKLKNKVFKQNLLKKINRIILEYQHEFIVQVLP